MRIFWLLVLLCAELGGVTGFVYPERFMHYPIFLGTTLGALVPFLMAEIIGLFCMFMGWEDEATLRMRDLSARSGHWL